MVDFPTGDWGARKPSDAVRAGGPLLAAGRVYVVVLNWMNVDDTLECLESLVGLEGVEASVIVCDNASPNDSVRQLLSWGRTRLEAINTARNARGRRPLQFRDLTGATSPPAIADGPEVVLIQTGANKGYAGGNNVGIRYALADPACRYVWVLNNDTRVHKDALAHMLARMERDPAIGLCGATLCYADAPDKVQVYGGASFQALTGRAKHLGSGSEASRPVDGAAIERKLAYIMGACMLASRDFLERVGLMEEKYFLYFEELEWARRARGRFKLGYAPPAIVYHKVGGSVGSKEHGEPSELSEYYLRRNRVRFCLEHSKISLPIVAVRLAKDLLKLAILGRWARAQLILRASLGLPMKKRQPLAVAPASAGAGTRVG